MDVTIYYTEAYDFAPSGVQRCTTPIEADMDEWLVSFSASSDGTAYGLQLRHLKNGGGKNAAWVTKRVLLGHTCSDMADYADWLCENVSYILVDGQLFWTNPGSIDEEDGGEV